MPTKFQKDNCILLPKKYEEALLSFTPEEQASVLMGYIAYNLHGELVELKGFPKIILGQMRADFDMMEEARIIGKAGGNKSAELRKFNPPTSGNSTPLPTPLPTPLEIKNELGSKVVSELVSEKVSEGKKEQAPKVARANPFEIMKDQKFIKEVFEGSIKKWGVSDKEISKEIDKFLDYWQEEDPRGKMRCQGEKYFDVKRRLATWFDRAFTTKK